MPSKPVVYANQLELPVAAEHEKSAVRKQEFDDHVRNVPHLLNPGLPDQMLVMTAVGPKMMYPVTRCSGSSLPYGCTGTVIYDDDPLAFFAFAVSKNNIVDIPDYGMLNTPSFRLSYSSTNDFFRFTPIVVEDHDLSQLTYTLVDNTAAHLTGIPRLIAGKMVFDLYVDTLVQIFDTIAVGAPGRNSRLISIMINREL